MADIGSMFTDKRQAELEKRLRRIYSDAAKDIYDKTQDFYQRFKVKDLKYRQMLKDGKITYADYSSWLKGQVFQGKQWQAKKDQITETLYQSNQIAARMVRGETVNVFTHNANFMSYDLEHTAGVNFGFGIYDSATVVRLIKSQPDLLPKPSVKRSKDKQWNSRKLTEQVTQGIIQGESLDKIAKRMAQAVSVQDWKFMRTYAQTAMAGAQNAGRQLSLQNAHSMGIKVKKEWMATLDGHTRTEHRRLDGQKVNIYHPFQIDGYSIMYPGDPKAHPAMVYNCRCTLVGDLEDYPSEYERYDNIEGKPIKNMTYEEWYNAKKGTTSSSATQLKTIGGATYGITYTAPITNDATGVYEEHTYTITRQSDYGFPNGIMNGVYANRDADIYTLDDGTKFIYPSDLDGSKQTAVPEFMIERYYQLPESYRRQIQKTIHVLDYRNPRDVYWEKQYNMPGFRSYATGGDEISFYADTYHDRSYVVKTFAHEGAHYIDLWKPNAPHISDSNKWKQAKLDDLAVHGLDAPTDYARTANAEDFAESVAEYLTNHDFFVTQFPHRAAIIKELISI